MKQLTSINQRFLLFLLVVLSLIVIVSAVAWSPQGNVNLKGRYNMTNLSYFTAFTMKGNIAMGNYNITGADYIFSTYFSGDGSLITGVPGINASFNQSLTDTLYYDISNPSSFWNDTYATFNKTYADGLYAILGYGDNWNKTYADTLYSEIEVNWTNLQNYPVACAGSSAITTLNDSVTCSDLWVDVAGDTMVGNLTFSGVGILNLSLIESLDWTNVTIIESQVSDLSHTTDTNASTGCSGTTTYLDGEGNCDDISSVYAAINEPLWAGNSTLVPYLASVNVFTANQNLTTKNITAISCIIFDSGGKICTGV